MVDRLGRDLTPQPPPDVHFVRMRAGGDELRRLASLAGGALSEMVRYREWMADYGGEISGNQNVLDGFFCAVAVLTDYVKQLCGGTFTVPPGSRRAAFDYQAGADVEGTPRRAEVDGVLMKLHTWLHTFEDKCQRERNRFPAVSDEAARDFEATVRRLKEFCGVDSGLPRRWVTAAKADAVRFLAPANEDPDNTKFVDRQRSNGRLDFRKAAKPIGKKTFEFLFTDPHEHARFEQKMGTGKG